MKLEMIKFLRVIRKRNKTAIFSVSKVYELKYQDSINILEMNENRKYFNYPQFSHHSDQFTLNILTNMLFSGIWRTISIIQFNIYPQYG